VAQKSCVLIENDGRNCTDLCTAIHLNLCRRSDEVLVGAVSIVRRWLA